MMLSPDSLEPCFHYYPFEGDFGMPTDRELRDSIVVAAKDHKEACHICHSDINTDTPHRVMVMKWSDESVVTQYRWCYDCCVAMLLYAMEDHGHAMDQRYRMAREESH